MCGIFGYIGSQEAVDIALAGLKRLEYRGYDSSGIAGIRNGKIVICKTVGKIAELQAKAQQMHLKIDMAIAHTRWATHGKPKEINAHPHTDTKNSLAVVHNGIIENHEAIRAQLKEKGIVFVSETDTEVVAQLIGYLYQGDILNAVQQAVARVTGSFALAVIHQDHPDKIIAAANGSPLVIGVGVDEVFLASDTHAFLTHTRNVIYLNDSEVALISPEEIEIYDASMGQVRKKIESLQHQLEEAHKGQYAHFTLKEIHEQPQTIRNALLSRYVEENGTVLFEELNLSPEELLSIQRILILGCGTSWHAGKVAAYMIEDKARLPVQVEIASEFRYKNPIIQEGTLVIAISQSGETADTLAAVREIKAKGAKVIAVCNVQGSTLARECDGCLFLRAGPEIGVCSTKAFTSQLVVLSLFALMLARMRHMSLAEGRQFVQALKQLPDQVLQVLRNEEQIIDIAKRYHHFENFFYVGRRYMYPISLEGALKLKEISYVNANGYPAGEMKHGPIALISPECLTIALCANQVTMDKMVSNLHEIKARNGPIIAIVEEGTESSFAEVSDEVIVVPSTLDELAGIPTIVAAQLLAYHIANHRGAEIDHPRNLAKSVTVE